MKKKVLILGGTSFIGFNLCLFLKSKKLLVHNIISNKKKRTYLNKQRISLLKKRGIKTFKLNFLKNKLFIKSDNNYDILINCIGWTQNYNLNNYAINKISK